MGNNIFLIIVIYIFLFTAGSFINSEESLKTNNLFSVKDMDRVKNGEIITRMYLKNDAVDENTDRIINVPKTVYDDEDFSIYEMITDEKAFIPYNMDSEEKKLDFYNILCAYSKLKGMKYFSRRIQKEQELIKNSYRIESPDRKKEVDDCHYSSVLPQTENYFVQKDNKFGELIFKSTIYNERNNFVLINTCMQHIVAGLLTICRKGEYKFITYFIYDEKSKGFFYYSANVMRIRLEFVLKKGKFALYPTTFSNRLRAATVQMVKLMGIDWSDRLNPWDEDKLNAGFYKNY